MSGTSGLTKNQLPSLITDTITKYKDVDVLNTTQTYHTYYAVDQLMRKGTYQVQGGADITYHIVTDDMGDAAFRLYHEPIEHNYQNPAKRGNLPWALMNGTIKYSRHEADMNRGQEVVVPYIKKEYFRHKAGMLNKIEKRFPLAPDSASDNKNPLGLEYWLASLPSGTNNFSGGFLGTTCRYGDGTATTTIGNIDRATEEFCRNWVANHAGMGMGLLNAMDTAMDYTDFQTPKDLAEYESARQKKRIIISGKALAIAYDQMRKVASNGSRNGDLSPFGTGGREYNGCRWIGLSQLDDVALEPLYILDLAFFFGVVRDGWWFRPCPVRDGDRYQEHLITQQFDCEFNFMCDNPRRVGAKFHRVW